MAKYAGRSTVWSRATTSSFGTVATINNVNAITPGFGSQRGAFDQSAFGDDWVDEGSGQQEGVEFTLTLQYDPADAVHVLLKSDYETPSANVWIRASHATADYRWNITTVPRGWVVNPQRDGSLQVEATYKIVNPGVVQETIP